jgi:hypothetical protein
MSAACARSFSASGRPDPGQGQQQPAADLDALDAALHPGVVIVVGHAVLGSST